MTIWRFKSIDLDLKKCQDTHSALFGSDGSFRVETQHELVVLWIQDIFGEVEVRHLAHPHEERHVTLTQRKRAAVFGRATHELRAHQRPGLRGALLLLVPDDGALLEVAVDEGLGTGVVGDAECEMLDDALHRVARLLPSNAQVLLQRTRERRED